MSNTYKYDSKKPTAIVSGEGLVALDVIMNGNGDAPRLSTGGSCGNVLAILSHLGCTSYPIAKLSESAATSVLIHQYEDFGVRLDSVQSGAKGRTPVIVQEPTVAKDGTTTHRFRFNCPNCGRRYPKRKILTKIEMGELTKKIPSTPNVFYFDRVSDATLEYANMLREKGVLIFFEPAYIGNTALFKKALASCHILKYSAKQLSLTDGFRKHANPYLEIRTMGVRGLQFRIRNDSKRDCDWISVPASPLQRVLDTSGAGDWCSAGIILGLSQRKFNLKLSTDEWTDVMSFAQALSGLNCMFEGAMGAAHYLNQKEIITQANMLLKKDSLRQPEQNIPSYMNTRLLPLLCKNCGKGVSYGIDTIDLSEIVP